MQARQLESERSTSLQQQEKVISKENEKLRETNRDVKTELSEKAAELARLEGTGAEVNDFVGFWHNSGLVWKLELLVQRNSY